MKGDFEERTRARVAVDFMVGDNNLKGKEGVVTKISGQEMIRLKFFDGTPEAWFTEDELKYLGTPGWDCPYASDYDRYDLEDFK